MRRKSFWFEGEVLAYLPDTRTYLFNSVLCPYVFKQRHKSASPPSAHLFSSLLSVLFFSNLFLNSFPDALAPLKIRAEAFRPFWIEARYPPLLDFFLAAADIHPGIGKTITDTFSFSSPDLSYLHARLFRIFI